MSKTFNKIAFFSSIFILFLVTYYAYISFKEYDKDALWVEHSERVKSEVMAMVSVSKTLSMNLRNLAVKQAEINSDNFNDARIEIEEKYKLIDSLVADNPNQGANLAQLKKKVDNHFVQCIDLLNHVNGKNYELVELAPELSAESRTIDSIGLMRNEMIQIESDLLKGRSQKRAKSAQLAPVKLVFLAFVALILISYLFINTFSLLDKNDRASKAFLKKVKELGEEIEKKERLQSVLKSVINSSTNGIQAFDSIRNAQNEIIDFKATIVNKRAVEIMEVSEEEQLNSTLLTITPGNKEAGLFDAYVDVVESGKTFQTVFYYEQDEFETWFDTTAVANGDGFVVTFADVTESKISERQLEMQKQELESANQELERFAYVASHDLQEPLRKIRTFGDRLADRYSEALDERAKDYILRMGSAAERMQVLINDLLKFSRISRKESPKDEVNLNRCLDKVLEVLELEIAEKQAVIHRSTLPTIIGDESQIEQLFQNLLTNSLKYSKKDLIPEINISCKNCGVEQALLEGEVFWKIRFEDNGIGFDNQYNKQIFQVFERLHGRTEYHGTGIGLALCEKILTRHGGRIEADGEVGKGAIFTVFLPA